MVILLSHIFWEKLYFILKWSFQFCAKASSSLLLMLLESEADWNCEIVSQYFCCNLYSPLPFKSKKLQNWHTSNQNEIISGFSVSHFILKGYEIKDYCGNWKWEIYNTNVNFLEKLKQQVEDGYLNYPKFDNWNISKNLPLR